MSDIASRSRVLALAILLGVIGFAWLLVIQPISDAFAAQGDAIARSHQRLAAYQRRIAMRPLIEARLAQLKLNEASSAGVVAGGSAELAAANIQKIIKTLIESEGGQVRTSQNLTPVSADGFQRIDVQYDASIPMVRLKAIAYRIETSVPYLFLDGLDLRGQQGGFDGLTPGMPPTLNVHWTVRGYRWTGAP